MVTQGYIVESSKELGSRCMCVYKTKEAAISYLKKRKNLLNVLFGDTAFGPDICLVTVDKSDILDDSLSCMLVSAVKTIKTLQYDEFMDGCDDNEKRIINDAPTVCNIFQ